MLLFVPEDDDCTCKDSWRLLAAILDIISNMTVCLSRLLVTCTFATRWWYECKDNSDAHATTTTRTRPQDYEAHAQPSLHASRLAKKPENFACTKLKAPNLDGSVAVFVKYEFCFPVDRT